jgi:N-hydroxyarylamine O-acetyltransferase
MAGTLDLDAYLRRIAWAGPVRRDRATLAGLLQAHMRHIPFENLDVLLARPVRLDLESVQRKLVQSRRGGYCFEHATLLAAALEALGFEAARHTARVVLVMPRAQSPRTHMFLTVPLDEGSFVLDPGLGGYAPRVPVPLAEGAVAQAGADAHWMEREGAYWRLRGHQGGREFDVWYSTLEAENPVDFELGNHYTATHPQSVFVNRLMMRALTPQGRITVVNRDVTLWRGTRSRNWQLVDRAALRALLKARFGFDLPEAERLRVPSIPEWD